MALRPLLRAFLLARVARSEVDDLDQLAWLRVWKSLPDADPGPFRAWLFQIARNALIDHSRKSKKFLYSSRQLVVRFPRVHRSRGSS